MKNIENLINQSFGGTMVTYNKQENTIYYRDVNLFEEIIEFIRKNELVVNLQINLL